MITLTSLPPAKIVTTVAFAQHERHLLVDEVAVDRASVLLAERLEVAADDGRWDAEIAQRDGESLGLQRRAR